MNRRGQIEESLMAMGEWRGREVIVFGRSTNNDNEGGSLKGKPLSHEEGCDLSPEKCDKSLMFLQSYFPMLPCCSLS